MPTTAHDITAELRARHPGLPVKKLHKLLYYCQGHHLATFGEPLFTETIEAWDMGPVVGSLWRTEKYGTPPPERHDLGEAELNTIGYVLSRYGALTGRDLENLTHGEDPWRLADHGRRAGTSARMDPDRIKEFFRTNDSGDEDEVPLDSVAVTEWLRGAEQRRRVPGKTDDPAEIKARIDELRTKLATRA